MALTYRILLICLLLTGITFSLGPWWAMRSISQAAKADDKAQWPHLVKPENFEGYANTLLSGVLKLKMQANFVHKPAAAMGEYQHHMKAVPTGVQYLTSPNGFSHLVCGDVFSEPGAKPGGTTGCWALDGKLTWQSPVQAKVTFINPETQWQSSLTLSRVGLFTWQADSIELPVETIIEHFVKPAGLKADNEHIEF